MNYTRGGRPHKPNAEGNPLLVEDLNMEGFCGKVYSKAGRVPKSYFQIRSGVKVEISKEEYEQIQESRKK